MSPKTRIAAAAAVLALTASCRSGMSLSSIRYGYPEPSVEVQSETPSQDQVNDMNSGWGPRVGAEGGGAPLSWEDGSPVRQDQPGTVTTTTAPINPGLDGPELDGGGSRSTLLDRYQEAMGRAEDLELANRDLSAALTATEESLLQATQELEQLKVMFDEMSALKTQVQQRNLDLAARLATAQIARLEAERSLLEATIEWRAMNARNNAPSGTPTELQPTGVR